MFETHLGEIISLGTAVCWTATALAFQQATRKAGSLSVNIIRLLIAFAIYAVVSFFVRGRFFPTDASQFNWIWMSISGLVGFVFGDYFLFKSYELISARISMLVFSLSPPFAAIISWAVLGETMATKSLLAMAVTLGGIILVVTEKKKLDDQKKGKRNNIKFAFPVKGLLFALLGTIGQSTGLVLSKYGMGDYNVFAATQIRIITGTIGFVILISIIRRWGKVKEAATNVSAMKFISIGAFFGPFIGVYLSLLAVKFTTVGIASTIMAIIPVLIIAPAILLYKEKVTLKEVIGAFITVGGVVLFFV
ncbi:MAG: DMT family transporter [Salinivirgaceae bacterium]|jgi:drug/metabolite transporter (DMT)-like permease|nr:DMT family transporter [Salinivirgaceae bacterium]